MSRFLTPQQEAHYPQLKRDRYQVTSDWDAKYNCIAHAAGENALHWWPLPFKTPGVYWPSQCCDETLDCFIGAFSTQGYEECKKKDQGLEPGIEKIAIYADSSGEPTHAARQLENGKWTSKLGDWEDIEHDTLEALDSYGTIAAILRRPRPKQAGTRDDPKTAGKPA